LAVSKLPQRTNRGNRSPHRYTGGRPRQWRPLRLAEADAVLLESVVGDLALDTALQRIAAAAAADPDGTRAALAPLLAVEAWQGEAL
jgi:hypothetical protein